ncbi:MAG: Gfo/Idh/MocA family oxidoreductase [Prevotellaceae bacterium]|jgi:predicted dehydrogenase|nr:Gfo/Idh/MocA family oxidoreductase [Prevotellaceae bacterium]
METVNWGIIGCGDVCEVKSGPAFYKTPHSALVAVMRRDAAKAQDFARRHGVAKYYTSADDLILDPEVTAVYVATPPDTHREYALKAMRAGKPVYVEKPLALNFAECAEMLRVSEETGVRLFAAFYRRALPYFLKVKELLPQIGKPLMVETRYFRAPAETDINPALHTWRVDKNIAGGGYFFDLAPHTLDILDGLLGEITEAQGIAGNIGGFYTVEDTVSAMWQHAGGAQGAGQWCFVSAPPDECDTIDIFGTQGSLHFNTFAFQPIVLKTENRTENFTAPQPQHIQQPLIQTIVDELRGAGKALSDGYNGARTAQVMDKIMS